IGRAAAFSSAASSRGLGAFQLCGLPRKICTTSAFSAAAAASGSCGLTCEPISTSASLGRELHASVTLDENEKAPGGTRGFFRCSLPIVAVAVVVQRNRSTG